MRVAAPGPDDLDTEARKLLSFTDNRQDASLQAGHFNDFVEVGLLRAALYRAVQAAGAEGISHEVLTAARLRRAEAADRAVRRRSDRQVPGSAPRPSAPCARCSATASTTTCAAAGA